MLMGFFFSPMLMGALVIFSTYVDGISSSHIVLHFVLTCKRNQNSVYPFSFSVVCGSTSFTNGKEKHIVVMSRGLGKYKINKTSKTFVSGISSCKNYKQLKEISLLKTSHWRERQPPIKRELGKLFSVAF